ncbi:TIGR01666 family membrane protein [Vibrio sp. OCN044]|uniref:TIGR01666 family membrane protein n=1 Tax=Vibrio tetraodonis subsp. pristinus TaxID=2695891 RepID=A0A6L8LX23_9VIBR|nr:YccS family putative transporter [Vibrio tetraodonis]MYM60335.1 TIGR01666 family membrane protein [Vibrio tetraodonis subsp. pristinus]
MQLLSQLHLYWANKTINYGLLILVALVGVVGVSWFYSIDNSVIPLILGVIAAALSETDDSVLGRIKATLITLVCFAIASFSIELLFSMPVLFAIGLCISTFGFIMLGAISASYASIAFGSLLVAVYTMLGAEQSSNIWQQPIWLLSGSIWYFILSITWSAIWPHQPVQQSLANVFIHLSNYLVSRSQLFHPVTGLDPQPYRIKQAALNAATVTALNQCKTTLLNRSKRGYVQSSHDEFLNIYFLAQDIHERISSSHYRYQELCQQFGRSDILFRFKHLLETQAQACKQVAKSIQLGKEYVHTGQSLLALDELVCSLEHLKTKIKSDKKSLINQLNYLFNNLATVEKQLSNICTSNAGILDTTELDDTEAHSLKEGWQRVISHFSFDSMLFRHAVRMSLALTVGYCLIQLTHVEQGYWILMTTLFVCQPNYSATRNKLVARVVGTILGLLVGVPLLILFPSQESQLLLIVVSGVAFFMLRLANYGYATGFITILVLFCFHQHGDGYAIVIPRLADTLIGCALAVLSVTFILPDWQSKRLHKVMAEAIQANQEYLAQIIGQYRIGKKDSLPYRIARRKAHNHDAKLNNAISSMLIEPGRYRTATDESFRFLTLSHALLSYSSALGAHRTRISEVGTHKLILDAHKVIHHHLEILTKLLDGSEHYDSQGNIIDLDLKSRLEEWREQDNNEVKMVLEQLYLIYRMLPELHSLAKKFVIRAKN